MQSRRLISNRISRLMATVMSCAVAFGIACFALIEPLDAGILPQDGATRYELAFWESIKDSNRHEDYEAYLKAYPEGRFVPLAQARAAYLRADSEKAPLPTTTPKIDEIEATYEVVRAANLRAEPSATSAVVGSVNRGDKVQVRGRVVGKNWFQLDTDTGLSGFIYGDLIEQYHDRSTATKPTQSPARHRATVRPNDRIATNSPVSHPKARRPNIKVRQLMTFKDCPRCPHMVVLPAGQFVMGDDRGNATEKPAHNVSIAKQFAIGKHEVTVAEWNVCVLNGGCSYSPAIAGTDPVAPIRGINWADAAQYVSWLSSKTGKPYRLPTEAEWEYAARGGTKTRYWWGDRPVQGMANCKDCGGKYDPISPATTRSYDQNPFGLHEMTGGVWEWVSDCWYNDYSNAPNDGSARELDNCRLGVLRGGSWRNDSRFIHSASRKNYDANVRNLANGFRVAMSGGS